MKPEELYKIVEVLEGPDHHSRLELVIRNGRWGTCVECPRSSGYVYPEECKHTSRYDHHLTVKPETLKIIEIYKTSLVASLTSGR